MLNSLGSTLDLLRYGKAAFFASNPSWCKGIGCVKRENKK